MKSDRKTRILVSLLGLCVIGLGVESYYFWQQNKRIEAAAQPSVSIDWPKGITGPQDNWDPSAEFMKLQKQMDQMMTQMSSGRSIFNHSGYGLSPDSPKITMEDDADMYKVVIEMPHDKDVEVNTNVSDNQLTIDGKVKQKSSSDANDLHQQAMVVSQFSQTMSFPQRIDETGVKVKHDNNQVVITLPKVG